MANDYRGWDKPTGPSYYNRLKEQDEFLRREREEMDRADCMKQAAVAIYTSKYGQDFVALAMAYMPKRRESLPNVVTVNIGWAVELGRFYELLGQKFADLLATMPQDQHAQLLSDVFRDFDQLARM